MNNTASVNKPLSDSSTSPIIKAKHFIIEHKDRIRKAANILTIILLVVLTLFRLYLCLNASWLVWTLNAKYDDYLMLRMANGMLDGNWLGPYLMETLTKGISYAFFLAIAKFLKIPYGALWWILMTMASLLFCIAVREKIRNYKILGIIYVFLLFSPVGFSSNISMRFYRNVLIPWIALIIVSCVIAIFFRRNKSIAHCLPWIFTLSLALPFFWYIREDSLWILPFVTFGLSVTGLIWLFKKSKNKRPYIKRTALLIIPFVFLFATSTAIKTANNNRYGLYTTNDRTGEACGEMMSLLYRIDDGNPHPDPNVWLSNESLDLALKASPTLASLPNLQTKWTIINPSVNVVYGDLAEWTIRSAVNWAGYYRTPFMADSFYKQVNQELKTAYQQGKLKERRALYISSQMKGLQTSDFVRSAKKIAEVFPQFLLFRHCEMTVDYSPVDESMIKEWEELLGQPLLRKEDAFFHFTLSGWLLRQKPSQTVFLTDANGVPIGQPFSFENSPDINEIYPDNETSDKCRFNVTNTSEMSIDQVFIGVFDGDRLIKKISALSLMDGRTHHAASMSFKIDKMTPNPKQLTLLSSNYKVVRTSNRIVRVYQILGPILALLTLFEWLKQTILIIKRKQTDWETWLVTLGIGLSLLGNIAIVVLFSTWIEAVNNDPNIYYFYASSAFVFIQIAEVFLINQLGQTLYNKYIVQ